MPNSISFLCAEDEKTTVMLYEIYFDDFDNIKVDYAYDGKEASDLYKENHYDLVITDMNMPKMNGIELIKEIKEANPEQHLMMISGVEKTEDLLEVLDLGLEHFLHKPVGTSKFRNKINFFIKKIQKEREHVSTTHLLEQYKELIDSSTIVTKSSLKGKITYINKAFCDLSGYTEEELLGKNHNIVRHPDVPKSFFEDMWGKLLNRENWNGVVKNRAKNGSTYYVHSYTFPILDTDNHITEFMSIRHDITELYELQEEIIDTQREVVFKMGAIGESRSKETGDHVKRVASYSCLLAHLYGLPEEQCELLKMASPMHDIGKVGIPDNILNKPGKLTKEEFEIMKTHGTLGYEMLKGSTRPLLKTAATVSHEHHEKWDGSGYPRGLKGEEISIEGRITALADVFDALGHDRCYKKAWLLEDIEQLFRDESGKHFDPRLVDLYFNNKEKFLDILNGNCSKT